MASTLAPSSCRGVAILGDPFLREHRLVPTPFLIQSKIGIQLKLTWGHVPAATGGYRIYRANSATSQVWTPIQDMSPGTTEWNVTTLESLGSVNAFMIKSRELKTTGAGSYHNLSVGTISNELTYP
ncbi:MAG TPA: hypothetical protein PLX89_26175 [Verrucomicrobiota bacterium]|nr:hypothetical protein [Verrucomicrobiota bacterium]